LVTFLKPWASMRERACASVKLLEPGSTAPVVCGLSAGLWVTAGLEDVPPLFVGCVVEDPVLWEFVDWATAAVARVEITASVAKPRRIKVLLLCVKHVGAQCAKTVTVPNARLDEEIHSWEKSTQNASLAPGTPVPIIRCLSFA
jgi:hypothetical protein